MFSMKFSILQTYIKILYRCLPLSMGEKEFLVPYAKLTAIYKNDVTVFSWVWSLETQYSV